MQKRNAMPSKKETNNASSRKASLVHLMTLIEEELSPEELMQVKGGDTSHDLVYQAGTGNYDNGKPPTSKGG